MKFKIYFLLLIHFVCFSTLFSQNTFQMPSQQWVLEIDLDGFTIEKSIFSPDSTMFQFSATNNSNLNLSIFIEKTDSKVSKEECRTFYWDKAKNSPLAKENLKKYETSILAIIEHDTKEYSGQIINFHSLNAYLVKNGYWIDIHISKIDFTKKDKKSFKKIKDSIVIK